MAKKKGKKKAPAQTGIDPNEKRRERLEARRQAKAAALAAKRRKQVRDKIVRRVVAVAVLGGLGWWIFFGTRAPSSIEGHEIQTFTSFGVNQHPSPVPPYEESPPVTGPHAQQTAFCGVHGAAIPDGQMVHTLEHGAVGLLYQPTLSPEDVESLEEIVGEYDSHVFSAPYEGEMETPISIVSWARRMDLNELDETAVSAYVDEFRDKGPERGQPCDHEADDPFEPPRATPSPGASPTAT